MIVFKISFENPTKTSPVESFLTLLQEELPDLKLFKKKLLKSLNLSERVFQKYCPAEDGLESTFSEKWSLINKQFGEIYHPQNGTVYLLENVTHKDVNNFDVLSFSAEKRESAAHFCQYIIFLSFKHKIKLSWIKFIKEVN